MTTLRVVHVLVCCCLTVAVAACTDGDTQVGTSANAAGPAAGPSGGGGLSAKRVGPPDVRPVTIGKVKYEAIHWGKDRGFGQNGGYIAAVDASSGKELWTLKVYDIEYDTHMESDVQDIFIKSMSKRFIGDKLDITDERGRKYVVDPVKRTVEPR